ncbi:GTPase [Candidatus Ventrimonas sp. KK005]
MKQEIVSISDWTQKSELLLQKVKNVLDQVGYKESSLPTSVFDVEKPISIVFVGQYSAGKSTIIKALTGIKDIETGEGIKTLETHSYDWNGIEVVDTPGINTTIRPDHDEISYKAIARADMLVYVITEELFDDFVGQNFRKLLLEKDKAAEMILVVNKMADIGNTEENRLIKLKDMEKVTTPYLPSDLRTVFVDAESYIDSLSEEDPDIAEELKERSNYDQLVETLNEFVADKGISSRLTTVLYKLFDILQGAIPHFQSSTGDDDVDAVEEHMLRERHIISQTSWRIESAVKAIYESAASEIRDKGRYVANDIYDCSDESTAEAMLEKAYSDVNAIASRCEKDVVAKIEELATDCQTQLDEFYNSDFSNSLRFRFDKRKDGGNAFINQILKTDWIAQGSSKIIANTTGANAAANGLKAFSGSNAHEWVLNIGHYFGHSFKPWEAVKWVKKINIAGKALGVFGVVFSWGMQAKEDIDEDRRNREIRANREKLRASFNDAANGLVIHYNNAMNDLLNENYRKRIGEIDNKVLDIRALRKNKSDACNLLEATQNECRQLISDIHRESIPQDV